MSKNTEPDRADLVEVMFAGDRIEAEMIQGLLESEDVPSLLQATGVDGRLLGVGLAPRSPQPRGYGVVGAYARIWLWSIAAFALALGVFLLVRAI